MKDRGFLTQPDRHLGKKIFMFGVAGLVVILIAAYLGMTGWYYVQIKQGKKINLQNPRNFTSSGEKSSMSSFDRKFLEEGNFPFRGKKDGAGTVIVEFLDYNCPNSRMIYNDVDKLYRTYGNNIKVIFRQFPATTIPGHEDSEYLSEIAFCGWKQGPYVFTKINNYLFEKHDQLPQPVTEKDLITIADGSGLDLNKLKTCLADPQTKEAVNKDFFDGVEAGVRGTPTFFINGEKVEGAVTFDVWKMYFDSLNP